MIKIGDYNKIMSDRNLFNQIVYTPLSDAIKLLNERQKDPKLMAKVKKLLNRNVPKVFKDKKCGVMARQLATPNYENRRFISLVKENGLHPVFIEYFDDKFTSNNKYKHSLGQLHIQNKIDKNGKECVEKITIIEGWDLRNIGFYFENNGTQPSMIPKISRDLLIGMGIGAGISIVIAFGVYTWRRKRKAKPAAKRRRRKK